MDLSAFTADINELVSAFVEMGGQELSQMKELWRSRSFSFIHEAKPSHASQGFFMQTLYCCALDFMGRNSEWSRKLGGLYVLYILYETQFSVPPYKIYLSTDDLENLQLLVKEAKTKDSLTALRVVNRMMVRDFFLYGSVTISGKKMRETYDEYSSKAAENVKKARKRILSHSYAKEHFEGNLIKDLGLDGLALLNEEYAMAKQQVLKGVSLTTQEDLGSLGTLLGEELRNEVKTWMEKRKRFFGKEDQESLLHSECRSERNLFGKLSVTTDSFDGDEETTRFNDPNCQVGGPAIDLNTSTELDDVVFGKELENVLEED
ncbi:hypothetical protein GOP47_0027689 [Adiantum capillus-veneris]|nr:hypothetical protein GOP47_0027689 [Adiantum capillus-veneris]